MVGVRPPLPDLLEDHGTSLVEPSPARAGAATGAGPAGDQPAGVARTPMLLVPRRTHRTGVRAGAGDANRSWGWHGPGAHLVHRRVARITFSTSPGVSGATGNSVTPRRLGRSPSTISARYRRQISGRAGRA